MPLKIDLERPMGRNEDYVQSKLEWSRTGVTGHERFRSLKAVALDLARELDRLTSEVHMAAIPEETDEKTEQGGENPKPTTAEIEAELDQREAEVSAVLQGEDIVDLEDFVLAEAEASAELAEEHDRKVIETLEEHDEALEDLAAEGEITEEEAAKLLGEDG